MFYKIGFFILLAIVIAFVWLFLWTNPMKNTGAMSWVDIYSSNPTATIGFLNENFGITVVDTTKDSVGEYNVIKAKGQVWPFAGIMARPKLANGALVPAGSMIYLTVKNFDEAHAKMVATGAKVNVEKMYAGGMWFGVYEIPGNIVIGIAEYSAKK